MYFKIEFNARVGQWMIYVCNRWVYEAVREALHPEPGQKEDDTKPRKLMFKTYDLADKYAEETGLKKTYVQRNFRNENQTTQS